MSTIEESVTAKTGGAANSMEPLDTFVRRHIGPSEADVQAMLQTLGVGSLDELIDQTIPAAIRLKKPLKLGPPRGEHELLEELRGMAGQNKVFRSFIGMGYYDTITPPVIQRNILENPGWYTQYTPYQAEIAQGRLEALLNFQTMVSDLTALPLANASLLDEGTAAAEAMAMCHAIADDPARNAFFVADNCHPQTIAVVQTRGKSLGIRVMVGDARETFLNHRGTEAQRNFCGLLLQYPATDGRIEDYSEVIAAAHADGVLAVVATDLLALTLIKPPGEFGADIAVGSAQRFGVPMGFGGPHAAFMATKTEYARKMPGRIVGVSKDAQGNPAYRLAIQTREQHIKREKATSNICTAQVLLAIMASMYAVYHGPDGLKQIACHVHKLTSLLWSLLKCTGSEVSETPFFDTIVIKDSEHDPGFLRYVIRNAAQYNMNIRMFDERSVCISLDETTTLEDVRLIYAAFRCEIEQIDFAIKLMVDTDIKSRKIETRTSPFLTHPAFNSYHSETELLRYIKRLESRDLSLCQSMIPLGSCTMKLNGTSEMIPVTWPEFGRIHPFAPAEQTKGYQQLFTQLEKWLAEITGFAAVSLQPNAGSQGEYAGLLAIRGYHESRGETHRNVCLIPVSAHGTNPASAVIAGFHVVPVDCDEHGSVLIADLQAKSQEHKNDLACIMVTYPSTHGVFEEDIKEICKIVHSHGGQVYMDGANMNAQVGLCRPGDMGADVCHLNLHKTFCIPHGGGGPGMGPIGVAKQLVAFLPGHPLAETLGGSHSHAEDRVTMAPGTAADVTVAPSTQHSALSTQHLVGPVASAPYGSASILPIPWVYIALMGEAGLKRATQVAILNANYMMHRLEPFYPALFKGKNGRCAHEFIIDCRQFEATSGVKVEDIAKRLMDYGFHAPTMSWPEVGTLMIEPTESESKAELDRLCDALIAIRAEIGRVESGEWDRLDNPLKNAPHTAALATGDAWNHKYSRQVAAFPSAELKQYKFWPSVGRIDNPYGDRNLICSCPPLR